jgi:hypothetical protein
VAERKLGRVSGAGSVSTRGDGSGVVIGPEGGEGAEGAAFRTPISCEVTTMDHQLNEFDDHDPDECEE